MKNTFSTILFLLILAFVIIDCTKQKSSDFTPVLNVYCIIRNDKYVQEAIITRTSGIEEDPNVYDLENVVAVLSTETHIDTFKQMVEFYITKDTVIMIPGEKYYLTVSADNFDTLIGEMTACGDFTIIYPHEGDTLNNIDSLVFTRGKRIKSLTVSLLQDGWPVYEYYAYLLQEDSIIRMHVDDIQLPEGRITIKIEEADSNFTDYRFFYNDNELPQFGVSGGIGVFGSVWIKSLSIFIDVKK